MEKKSFWKLLRETRVVIPSFQRDYAQGRNALKEASIRQEFVENLFEALDDNRNEIHLDFIYGTYDSEDFNPLDGQQRLTTLYLLHLYLAMQAGKLESNKDIFLKFRYETRQSSTDFCRDIIKGWDLTQKPADAIKDAPWYALSWDQDPTIVGILTMLDTIHTEFIGKYSGKALDFWGEITKEDSPIFFYVLDYKDEKFKLSDELYIKMNARGRPLTPFENFKASFLGFIGEKQKEDEKKRLGKRFDKDWTDFFWGYTQPNIVDNYFKNFLDHISRLLYYRKGGSQNDLPNGFELYKEVYEVEGNFEFVFGKNGVLSKLSILGKDGVKSLFEGWFTDQREEHREKVFIQREKEKQNLLDAEDGVFKNGTQDNAGDRFLYFLFCILGIKKIKSNTDKAIIHNELTSKEFLLKLRILRNLVWNTDTTNDNLKAHLEFIENLINSSPKEALESPGAFSPNQKREELKKLAYAEDKLKRIVSLENHPILLGTVNAFLDNDTCLTDEHIHNFYTLFEKKDGYSDQFADGKNLLRRALLCFSEVDGKFIKKWYMVKNLGHCDLCRNSEDWKKSFTAHSDIYFKLLNAYASHQGDADARLRLIIKGKLEDIRKFPDWLQKCINFDLFEGIKNIDSWYENWGGQTRLMTWDTYQSKFVGLYPRYLGTKHISDYNENLRRGETYEHPYGIVLVKSVRLYICYEYENHPLYSLWIKKERFPIPSSFKFENQGFKSDGEWHYIDNISEEKIGECIEGIKKSLE